MRAATCLDGPEDVISAQNGGFLVVEPGMPVRVVTVEEHYVARIYEFSPKRHRIGLIVNDPHSACSRFAGLTASRMAGLNPLIRLAEFTLSPCAPLKAVRSEMANGLATLSPKGGEG